MKPIRLLLIISLSVMMVGCIERISSNRNLDAAYIDNAPRVIRDTIVVRDTIVKENVAEVAQQVETSHVPRATAAPNYNEGRSRDNDDYDAGNSGFFDTYRSSYKGDPNAGISNVPTKKVVKTGNADELERKKAAIEQSLNLLEKRNEQEQQRYQEMEKERQAFNEKAVQDARKEQQKQQGQKQQQPKSKTLDTNLLLNRD